MAKAKTPKQLDIKIRSLTKQLKKFEAAKKKAMAVSKKKPVRRKAKRKAVKRRKR